MGELKVEIVDMERSLAGQDQSLVEDFAATFAAAGGRLFLLFMIKRTRCFLIEKHVAI